MSLFVDSSVWSLALRRDVLAVVPETVRLRRALEAEEGIFTTGLVLQELLQGFHGAKAPETIRERLGAVPLLVPDREDHVEAAATPSSVAGMASSSGPSMPYWPAFASAMT